MKGHTMDKELFEQAIAPYTKKVKDVIPAYQLTIDIEIKKVKLIGVNAKAIKNHFGPGRPVNTPDGSFKSIYECAKFYQRSGQWVHHRIKTGEFTI